MYVVLKIRETYPAEEDEDIGTFYLMCAECGDCSYKYFCTCIKSGICSLMCKHIHAVVLTSSKTQPEIQENPEPPTLNPCPPQPIQPVSQLSDENVLEAGKKVQLSSP